MRRLIPSNFLAQLSFLGLLCALGAGCATTGPPGDAPAAEETAPAAPARELSRVTLRIEQSSLGEAVRRVGEVAGGGIALMNGLEDRVVGPIDFDGVTVAAAAERLARQASLEARATPHYHFLMPAGYESLLELDISGRIDPGFPQETASVAFGGNTALFNVLAALGKNLNATFVADNAVADARCGEFALLHAPLPEALNAILRTARIPPGAVVVESTPEYVFFVSAGNQSPRDTLLNGASLSAAQRALLEERVSVVAPYHAAAARGIAMLPDAARLADVVPDLARQLELPVTIEAGLEDLPVNYTVLNNVRTGTAIDLIVRQWLQPSFGYEMLEDGTIHIRTRRPRAQPAPPFPAPAAAPEAEE